MTAHTIPFIPVEASLADLVGASYVEAVCEARACLSGEEARDLLRVASQPVDFYPAAWHQQLLERLPQVGAQVCAGAGGVTAEGASTRAFTAASQRAAAPLTGYGFYRAGEDGRLYLITKSEHYHTPVGHAFPGYALLESARRLGLPSATHNNTRGHVTRLLEETLVHAAHDPSAGESEGLSRVLNLETGSLAVEAGVKMMLARHYRVQDEAETPPYRERTPVFLVMGNDGGGLLANYHGTTVLTQMMRGMWPELYGRMEAQDLFCVCPIRPNSVEDLDAAFACYERPPYKIAGFLHEIVMMNYGARLLSPAFLKHAYALCARHDVPTLVDEIQSGLWAPGLFLFREYGLRPACVALGKGFSGGEYPASRLLFNSALDILPQFGALVTNGQNELASLAYLITMRWAQANAEVVREIGDYYEERLRALAVVHTAILAGISGSRHLLGIEFRDLTQAQACAAALNRAGFDLSVQGYKSECPPVALTKLPLTACKTVVDFVVQGLRHALETLEGRT
jgi:acetylornithine/succinyldiaminopimelate/putrescine aminotransferase